MEELIRFFKDKSAVSDEDKEALEYIRYLFKDFAFRDEEEFRLLVIKPIDSEEIEYCKLRRARPAWRLRFRRAAAGRCRKVLSSL